jgi:hypothetical protein
MMPVDVQVGDMVLKCKVFTATKFMERESLGDKVTAWLDRMGLASSSALGTSRVVRADVRQSSDSEFHCFTIVLWYT